MLCIYYVQWRKNAKNRIEKTSVETEMEKLNFHAGFFHSSLALVLCGCTGTFLDRMVGSEFEEKAPTHTYDNVMGIEHNFCARW